MDRRKFLELIAAAGAAAAAWTLAGCGTGGTPAPAGGAGGAAGTAASTAAKGPLLSAEITVTQYPALMYGVPYIAALEKGYFKEAGLDIKGIVGSDGGGTTVRNVITGGLPFGEVATPAAFKAWAAGAPLVIVGGGVRSVAEINWVTLNNNSKINKIQDLKGKKVGFTNPGSVTEGVLTLSLKRAGIDPKDVQLVAMGGVSKGLTALKEGAIDAAANMEPIYSNSPKDWKVVFWAKELLPNFLQTVQVVGPALVKENPDAIKAVLAARAKGLEYTMNKMDEVAEMYAKVAKLPKEVCLNSLKNVDPKAYFGVGLEEEGMKAVEEEMEIVGLIKKGEKIPWKEIVNQSFLPDGVRRVNL